MMAQYDKLGKDSKTYVESLGESGGLCSELHRLNKIL